GWGAGLVVVLRHRRGPSFEVAAAVEGLAPHASGDLPPSLYAYHLAEVIGAQPLGHPGRVAQAGGGMAVLVEVVRALAPVWVAAHAAQLAQPGEPVPWPGEQLVDIRLVAGIPEDPVVRAVERPVQGQGQLHHAQVRTEMPPRVGQAGDEERASVRD